MMFFSMKLLLFTVFLHLSSSDSAPTEDKIVVKGCAFNETLFIEVGQTIQMPECVQTQCFEREHHVVLATAKCPTSQGNPPPGCSRLPRPDGVFPDCCVDVFHCVQIVETLVPVVYDNSNLTQIDEQGRKSLLAIAGVDVSNDDRTAQIDNEIHHDGTSESFDHKEYNDKTKKILIQQLHKTQNKK